MIVCCRSVGYSEKLDHPTNIPRLDRPKKNKMKNNWSHILLHIPPLVSKQLMSDNIHQDIIINTQLADLSNDIASLSNLIKQIQPNKTTINISKLIMMIPPPLLPQLPPPSNKVKKLFRNARQPGIGRGNSILKKRKTRLVKKDFYNKLLFEENTRSFPCIYWSITSGVFEPT